MKKSLFLILILAAVTSLSAQEKTTFPVLGKVVDSSSRQPLNNASVYCQNTTYGTISNNDGNFYMRLPAGGYDLVVSYTGYEKRVMRISNNLTNKDTLLIELVAQSKAMEEVAIVATNEVADGWLKYGKFFTDQFIGTTPNAAECFIQNPEALRFFYTKKRNRLKVTAKEDVVILNQALGYKIRYQLDSFSYDYNTNISQYTGSPFFQEIDSTREARTKWHINRARTYLGSRLQFMHSLYDQTVAEDGYTIEKMNNNPKDVSGVPIENLYDTASYLADSSSVELVWSGRYRISYKPVLPDKKFLEEFHLPANSRSQVTILDILNGFVIEENGYFYDQYDVVNSGYWAWKKLAELLPYDYVYE
ncbi:MAG TPA: carboxypeptidase-like regulatory domain-containing protein [Flavitalea sp.]|nr:carboxypeptidase-like regulatory domain-containing protein [Flavitalea sp.]